MAPTIMGAMNIPMPEKVMKEPQITATLSGVAPGSRMGTVSRVGTYSQEPMPSATTDRYMAGAGVSRKEPSPPAMASTPDSSRMER